MPFCSKSDAAAIFSFIGPAPTLSRTVGSSFLIGVVFLSKRGRHNRGEVERLQTCLRTGCRTTPHKQPDFMSVMVIFPDAAIGLQATRSEGLLPALFFW